MLFQGAQKLYINKILGKKPSIQDEGVKAQQNFVEESLNNNDNVLKAN